jgi:hypothetical protein
VLIQTQRLSMRDKASPRLNPKKRRFKFKSVTRESPDENRIALPEPGSAGDPTRGGAELRVYNSAGVASDDVTVLLPASGWRRLGNAGDPRGYRFRSGGSGPIEGVVVRTDRLVIRGGGESFAYTLDEPSQGRIAVRLELGSGVAFCAEAAFPMRDRMNRFFAKKDAPRTSCP